MENLPDRKLRDIPVKTGNTIVITLLANQNNSLPTAASTTELTTHITEMHQHHSQGKSS